MIAFGQVVRPVSPQSSPASEIERRAGALASAPDEHAAGVALAMDALSLQVSELPLEHDLLELLVLTDDGGHFERIAAGGDARGEEEPARVATADSLVLRATSTSTGILIPDMGDELAILAGTREAQLFRRGLRSLIAVPLLVSGRPVGVMTLLHRHRGYYQEADLVHARWISAQVAVFLPLLQARRRRDGRDDSPCGEVDADAALDALLRRLGETNGVHCAIDESTLGAASPELAGLALQVVEMLLRTLIEHGRSRQVGVRIAYDVDHGIAIWVTDHGSGEADAAPMVRRVVDRALHDLEEMAERTIRSRWHDSASLQVRIQPRPDERLLPPQRKPPLRMPIRLLLASGQPVIREGIASILFRQDDIRLVGMVEAPTRLLGAVARTKPDIVLLDVTMITEDGHGLIQQLAAVDDAAAVLLLSNVTNRGRGQSAMLAGATGIITTAIDDAALAQAVRAAVTGTCVFNGRAGRHGLKPLSEREQHVLELLVLGKTNDEIAREVFVGTKTVERTVAGLVEKLGARNRVHAVARAVEDGLIGSAGQGAESRDLARERTAEARTCS